MTFWWHYGAALISRYCVVTASNHASSLARRRGSSGELIRQIYEG